MFTGKQLYDLGVTRLGDDYRLGSLVPKNNAKWQGPWDCSELTSWLVYQISGKLYGCVNNNGNPASADAYTGYWRRDAQKLGIIISVEQATKTKGAFLLRYSGSGLIGHIVCSDGKGGTVEAHSTKKGLILSVVSGRRWDIGILIPGFEYTEKEPVKIEAPKKVYRFTTPLMRNDTIKIIQQRLKIAGIDVDADGIYGSKTFYAVREFQNKQGLVPDGEVGPLTAEKLGLHI